MPISPAYLSKIERNEFPPAAECTICPIAELLDQNSDEFLAHGGTIASDLVEIIWELTKQAEALREAQVPAQAADA